MKPTKGFSSIFIVFKRLCNNFLFSTINSMLFDGSTLIGVCLFPVSCFEINLILLKLVSSFLRFTRIPWRISFSLVIENCQ